MTNRPTVWRRLWFGGGILFTVAAPLYIGIELDDQSASWIAFLIGAFITLMSRFDEIAEFSLGPLRARMREKIEEATATIEQTRSITLAISKVALTDLMAGNFFDSTTLAVRLSLHDNLVRQLEDIGASAEQIADAENMWRRGIAIIYHRSIRREILQRHGSPNQTGPSETPEMKATAKGFQDLLNFAQWMAPSPAEMESYLRSEDSITPEIQAWIDDYRHYLETGIIRRRDLFEAN
ncbi:MAG: hypothetical protein IID55_14255 [Proteobacteria bacterium]|nr:hypothetical protein [Pseudomonadota bacterium]